ncbi:YmfQ family protein [Anaerophilus nitritogenes]|uniref:YmfQ family protein n=1 Tax=Anaerophilus nitritogenes TaxID=2498136 RepID=UPI00101DB902|nr:YmfQ family protein [Anaerophilus nitritogenes]
MSYSTKQYGQIIYGEEDTFIQDDIESSLPDLMKYLPRYYQESKTMKELQNSIGKEFGVFNYYIKDVEKQFFIDTATWGLAIYEKELGIPTNVNLSLEERREIIKAKWRGSGTTTKQMIKNTAEAFSGGEVDVIEYPEEGYFVIKFIGVKGIPRNMESFKEMLETIKPAHLAYEFKYILVVWQMLKNWNTTWKIGSTMTWNELRQYRLDELNEEGK